MKLEELMKRIEKRIEVEKEVMKHDTRNSNYEVIEKEYNSIIEDLQNLNIKSIEGQLKKKDLIDSVQGLSESSNDYDSAILDYDNSLYSDDSERTSELNDEVVDKKYDIEQDISRVESSLEEMKFDTPKKKKSLKR